MAEFITKCPHCGADLQVQDEWSGMEVECPCCNKNFTVPKNNGNQVDSAIFNNNSDTYENSDDFFSGIAADRTQVENIIDKWLSEQPGSPIQNITSFLSFKSAVAYPVFSLLSKFEILKREFTPFTAPYRGESLSKNVFVPTNKDFWQYESENKEDFERIINDSLIKKVCHKCHGEREVTCDKCKGSGKVTCYECNGKGVVRCSECYGSGEVDRGRMQSVRKTCSYCGGRGYKSGIDEPTCSFCHGKGCYYKDEHVPELHTCPDCRGSGTETCSVCRGGGKLTCPQCHGSGTVCCPTCEGEGSLIDGYKLNQKLLKEKHYAVWSPEPAFPSAVLTGKQMLNSMGKIIKTVSSSCFCNSIPDDFPREHILATQKLLQIASNDMPEKDNCRFNKHEFEFRELTFIRYEGIEKTHGKHYIFWVNPENNFVIDQDNMFNDLAENLLSSSSDEPNLMKSLRLAVTANLLNRNPHDLIPSKLLNIKLKQIKKLIWIGLGLGVLFAVPGCWRVIMFSYSLQEWEVWVWLSPIVGILALICSKTTIEVCLRHSNLPAAMIPVYALPFGYFCFFDWQYANLVFLICCIAVNFFFNPAIEAKSETKLKKFMRSNRTIKAFSYSPYYPAVPFAAGAYSLYLYLTTGALYTSQTCYFFILAFAVGIITGKTYHPYSVNDVKQKDFAVGEHADSDEVTQEQPNKEKPWGLVLDSLGDSPRAVIERIGQITQTKMIDCKQQDFVKSLPVVIASAASAELLTPYAQELHRIGAHTSIVNIGSNSSDNFLKENPTLKKSLPDKDRPYGLLITSVSSFQDTATLMQSLLGIYATAESLSEKLPFIIVSASSAAALKNIQSRFYEIGTVSVVISDTAEDVFSLIVVEIGENKDAVLDFINKYSFEKQSITGELQLPYPLLKKCTQSDVLFCKQQLCELGAAVVCGDWINRPVVIEHPEIKIAASDSEYPFALILLSYGSDFNSVCRILNNFCAVLKEIISERKTPVQLMVSSSYLNFEQITNALRDAGAICCVMNTQSSEDTFKLILTDLGKNEEKTRKLLKEICDEEKIYLPFEIISDVSKKDVLFLKKIFDDLEAYTICADADDNEIQDV